MNSARLPHVFVLVMVLLLIGSACRKERPEPRLETHRTIPSQGENRAVVTIKMAAGEMEIRGGADGDLMKGAFYYNRRPWEPRIDHQVSDGVARLLVEQRRMGPVFGRVRNKWSIELSPKTPMELRLDLGVGKAEIDLGGVPVTKLDIQVGVGGIDLDLSGARKESVTGQIEGGIGRAEILLPADVGVRIRVEGGLGSIDAPGFIKDGKVYRNEAWGKTPVSLDLDVEAGIGRIVLRLNNSRSVSF
ncbi:MAG: toast rack family protein [Candidatus Aminicenantes bacterium]|nr:toast rack family protein [Candidatus Aminicenantes bacterium]